MVSTGFNGAPILILDMDDAEEIHAMMLTLIRVKGPLYNRVTGFLREAKEHVERASSEHERPGFPT